MSDNWYTEYHREGIGLTVKIKEHLFSKRSPFQKVDVYDTYELGKLLTLDGLVMVSEKDEFVYHESIIHPAAVYSENIDNILVIGGGDGGSVRELLKYETVKKITLVEIDSMVIDVSKKFFPGLSSGFDSDKVEIVNSDIMDYFKKIKEKFDLIIVDTSDPVGPAEKLYSDKFYSELNLHLNEKGIVSVQSESPWWYKDIIKRESKKLSDNFTVVKPFVSPTLTYPGGYWLFQLGSTKNGIDKIHRKLPANLKYFNENLIKNLFVIPEFVKEMLNYSHST